MSSACAITIYHENLEHPSFPLLTSCMMMLIAFPAGPGTNPHCQKYQIPALMPTMSPAFTLLGGTNCMAVSLQSVCPGQLWLQFNSPLSVCERVYECVGD
ncbi:hypothetical protein ATANTOWER_015437 [Ataeniobius toweri]|uniref:Uncharacterized protein n=1 Tax=Ataeniobius toweri TaxID=208326 RepID=A0ABU7BGH4_9TELE|nr:hypothetical protein [Ataeniobius toweri]